MTRRSNLLPVSGAVAAAALAVAGDRALTSLDQQPGRRRGHVRAYAANLVLDAGWTWTFFRLKRPLLAVLESAALTASTVDLTRRTWRVDRTAGVVLLPYAGWVSGATVLAAEILRRNR